MPTPNAHALLSASSAHRWLKCTAAPLFEQNFPSGTSEYAEEGTLAHSVCELYGRKKFTVMSTRKFNSELKKLQAQPRYSEEMIRTAEAYVEYLTEKAMGYTKMPHVTFEVKVDLTDYIPEGFGTCDCAMIGDDTLHITDYKHGKGVAVDAKDNPQMRLYALGVLKLYLPIYGDTIKKVSMGICQPRLTDYPSEDVLSVEELLAWGESIKPVAQEAFNGPGTFCPGEHCRFCRGKAQCRARADQNSAFADFKDCVPAGRVPPEQASLPAEARTILGLPPILTDAEIGELLIRAESLVQWYKDLQEYATESLLAGKPIPGWKVVAGKSNRAFKDTDAATDTPDAVEIATQQKAGIVKPDGDTILVMEDGTIKAAVKVALATVDTPGIVAPDGDTILIDEKGKIRAAVKVNIATTDAAGIVKPDGTTIEVEKDGKIKANIPDCYTKAQVDQMLSDISSLLMTDADLELLYSATDALMGENNTYSGLGTNIVAVNTLADELLK